MSEFAYQTIQVQLRAPMQAGPTTRGQAVGAGVKLLHKSMVALNRMSVSWRVNRELEKLAPQIRRAMPPICPSGVLVVVGIQEWAAPDATGTRAQTFLSIHIGGAGADPNVVLRLYLAQSRMVQGAARGWRRRDEYLWVTPADLF